MTGQPISLDVLAVWADTTRRLLMTARNKRDLSAMRLANLRLNSPKFKQLSEESRAEMMLLHGAAMVATGPHAP